MMNFVPKQFTKTEEDFTCINCGREVTGNGYTNHCPGCLHSQHVDNNPGDRCNPCHGLMKPITIEKRGDEYYVVHECVNCGEKKKNVMAPNDNFDEAVKIAKNSAAKV